MADQLSSLPVRSSTSRPTPQANLSPEGRVPLRDNTRLLLFGVGTLALALGVLLVIAGRSTTLSPDFLSGFVLYALTATNVAMLAALSFVLARNIIKLVVEQKRSLPFARFRAKLVAALLGMTLIPAVLVLIVGSELIRNSVDRWFNAPMDEVLSSALTRSRTAATTFHSGTCRVARTRSRSAAASAFTNNAKYVLES